MDVSEKDVYDFMLTQGEIQDGVDNINTAVKREIAQAKSEFSSLSLCLLGVRTQEFVYVLVLLGRLKEQRKV